MIIKKIAFALFALVSIGFVAAASAPKANAGRCWVAGHVVCCITPSGVQCN